MPSTMTTPAAPSATAARAGAPRRAHCPAAPAIPRRRRAAPRRLHGSTHAARPRAYVEPGVSVKVVLRKLRAGGTNRLNGSASVARSIVLAVVDHLRHARMVRADRLPVGLEVEATVARREALEEMRRLEVSARSIQPSALTASSHVPARGAQRRRRAIRTASCRSLDGCAPSRLGQRTDHDRDWTGTRRSGSISFGPKVRWVWPRP